MKGTRGFTVVELLMTIVIGSILVAVAVPSYTGMVERNAVSTTSNELLSGLLLARSEAIRQVQNPIDQSDQTVTLSPSSNGWEVNMEDGTNLINYTVDSNSVTIDGNDITYNARGRANLASAQSIDISYDGTVKSRVCLSLTGRPFTRSADDGVCP
ncbi:MAG: GspH/FimT family pseudopilin [Candidatus Thiodiazotropha sp. 6PLUC10]